MAARNTANGDYFGSNWHFLLVEAVLLFGSISLAWIAFGEITASGWTATAGTSAIVSFVLGAVALLYGLASPPRSAGRLQNLWEAHPEVVEVHPNGKVVVAGHRVSLFQIMEALDDLGEQPYAVRALCERYPTIAPEQMAEVVNFLRLYELDLRGYYAREKRIAETTIRRLQKKPPGPTRDELRRRREEHQHSA